MNLSISTCIHESFRWSGQLDYTPEDALTACAEAGFCTVELNLAPYAREGRALTKDGWENWIRNIRAKAHALNLRIGQVHAYAYTPGEWEQGSPDLHEKMLCRSAEAAALVDGACLVIHPDSLRRDGWYSRSASMELSRKHIESCRAAVGDDLPIAVENMPTHNHPVRFGCSAEDLMELIAPFSDKDVGICWDFGHAALAGIDQPAALDAVAKRLIALHVNDNNGVEDRHYPPYLYRGGICWETMMAKLKAIGYSGDLNLEVRYPATGLPDDLQRPLLAYLYQTGTYLMNL